MSMIKQFFNEKVILVSGATGFLGKVLLYKLLASIPLVKKIYLLIRYKKGKSPSERILTDIIRTPIFDQLRAQQKDFDKWACSKLEPILGDITKPKLGFAEADRQKIINEVEIIINVAADVSFNQRLDTAIANNVRGPMNILQLAKELKHCLIFTHVSTAYVNCNKKGFIEEKIYDGEFENVEELIKSIEEYPKESIQKDQHLFYKGFPNTYSFAKNLAERMIRNHRGNLPVIIVRPSIVGSSYKEPVPGWIDNINASGAILFASTTGFLKEIEGNENTLIDLCVVDYCVNFILGATTLNACKDAISIYHFASSSRNPIYVTEFIEYAYKYWAIAHIKSKNFGYPALQLYKTSNAWKANFVVKRVLPIKIMMLLNRLGLTNIADLNKAEKLLGKVVYMNSLFRTFGSHTWIYKTEQTDAMNKLLPKCDQLEFEYDMKSVNWEVALNYYLFGLRRYILKDVNINDPIEFIDYIYQSNRKYFSHIKYVISHGRPPVVLDYNSLKSAIFNSKIVKKAIEDKAEEIMIANKKLQYTDEDSYKAALQYSNSLYDSFRSEFNLKIYRTFGWILFKILNRLFESIIANNKMLTYIKTLDHTKNSKTPLIFIPTHKSYMDFLLLQLVIFNYNISQPLIVAGEDFMKIPIIGKIFQSCGAFYIRRKIKNDELYKKMLREFVTQQLVAGNNLEFFIEGGRQRYGVIRNTKFGILSYVGEAIVSGKIDDALIIPVSISYDKVIEDHSFEVELFGEQKVEESLGRLINASTTLLHKYGKARLHFDKPQSFKELLSARISPQFNPFTSQAHYKVALKHIGKHVINSFISNNFISITSLSATALLKYRFSSTESKIFEYVQYLHQIIVDLGYKTVHSISLQSFRESLVFLDRMITQSNDALERTISIAKDIKANIYMISFYRNNLLPLFIFDSIVCLCLRNTVETTIAKCNQILNMIEIEYYEDFNEGTKQKLLQNVISKLIQRGIILSKDGSLTMGNIAYFQLMKDFIMPIIDSYYVSFLVVSGMNTSKYISEKDIVRTVAFQCQLMLKEGKIKYMESSNSNTIQIAINRMMKTGIIELKSPSQNNTLNQYVYVLNKSLQNEGKPLFQIEMIEGIKSSCCL